MEDGWYSATTASPMHTVMKPEYMKVFQAIAAIPPGRVASYGAIAARVGLPGRARLVGRLMSEVPEGMILPWFRVLRSSGHIAMPPGSRGFREQCRLLRAEGVEVKNGRVPLSRFGLDADVDRALWGLHEAGNKKRGANNG
jgi:methylated-DNA-protein-cysteine methyltransferase-like protein